MMIYDDSLFSIYFGDRFQKIEPDQCKSLTGTSLFSEKPFSVFQEFMHLSAFTFLHQVHKADGKIIKNRQIVQDVPLFFQDGDYLITDQPTIGLGIVTADCLPIVYFDRAKKVVGVAHAGWKGSVAGIATNVVVALQKEFFSEKKDIEIFFGPAAKQCCYEVDKPFLKKIGTNVHVERALCKKNERYFFDLALYNASKLISFGFSSQQVVFDYNICTICNDNFCSYRRQAGASARQITVVSLK